MKVGGKYNWKGQSERLIYLGIQHYPGNGFWFQFAKVDEPEKVWSEVREADLAMLEETPVEVPLFRNIYARPPTEVEAWNTAVEQRKEAKRARKAKKEQA